MGKIIRTYYANRANRARQIVATDDEGHTVRLPADDHHNDHAAAAAALCRRMNWGGSLVAGGSPHAEMMHVFLDQAGINDDAAARARGVLDLYKGYRGRSDRRSLSVELLSDLMIYLADEGAPVADLIRQSLAVYRAHVGATADALHLLTSNPNEKDA